MNTLFRRQKGASGLVNLILLIVVGYGIFVLIQYVPDMIESKSYDAMLDTIETQHASNPVTSVQAANESISKILDINDRAGEESLFSVNNRGGNIEISIEYDRDLNLLYTTKVIHYRKIVTLN